MNLHLAEIAATVAPAAHAILLVDQAGWHLSTRLLVPANITIILLPPKCPELNPVKNVWQFMRDNWLSNRIFKSYDDLVDHCCAAWNKLVDQPWRIMSIGLRQWAPRVLINGIWYKPISASVGLTYPSPQSLDTASGHRPALGPAAAH
jgi:transposase